MPRVSPLHPRTSALCRTWSFKEWSGYVAPCSYIPHSEREYFAVRHTAGLMDASPLYKLDVTGPGAAALLSRVWTRDATKLRVGQVAYSALCDARGRTMDDGNLLRLGPEHFRVSSAEPWHAWHVAHARGLDVEVVDTSRRLAVLALQGPLSREILRGLVDFDIDRMRYFRVRSTSIAGRPGHVSRTGYTGDLGYELWCEADDAVAVWDAVWAAGQAYGLDPLGLDALDVVRLEAGYVLQGVDYVSAKAAVVPSQTSSPFEAGLGWTVDLADGRGPFTGHEALRAEAAAGSPWTLVGIELSWEGLEALYAEYGLPPHLAPIASRTSFPLYDARSKEQVGQVTSSTWSPLLKRYIGIGQVKTPFAATGAKLRAEHTVEHERRGVDAVVVERPCFDPPRKRATPGREAQA